MSRSTFFCLAFLFAIQGFGQKRVESYKPIVRHSSDGLHITNTNDGGLLVYGFVDYIDGQPSGLLSKVHADGTLWPGFTRATGPGWITKAAITPAGKILVMGPFEGINGSLINNVALLNADGTHDPTFDIPFDINDYVYDFAVQSDGRIIVAISGGLQRLLPDGSIDLSYNPVSGIYFDRLALDSNDKLYAAGNGTLRRYNTTGAMDNTFPEVTVSNIRELAFYGNGDIFIGGNFETVNGTPKSRLARISPAGILDTSFDANVTSGNISSICFRNDNIIIAGSGLVVGGTFTSAVEVLPTGELHENIAMTIPAALLDVTLIDDKLTMAGGFSTVNGQPRVGLAQVNTDNSVSEDFNVDVAYGFGWSFLPPPVVDSQNRLIVFGGGQPNYRFLGLYESGAVVNRQILRLNINGLYEPGWDIDESFIGEITAAAIQPDDKIILGGNFNVVGEATKLVRLMPDGTIDPSFNVSVNQGATIFKILVQENHIYVSGHFSQVNGQTSNSMAVLDFDGNLTQVFPDLPPGIYIHTFNVQQDGKIILAYPTSQGMQMLRRFNPDGTTDESFSDQELGGFANDILTDAQGLIYVAGLHSGSNSWPLLRLMSDGEIDNSFIGGGFFQYGDNILAMTLLPNNRIMLGGFIKSYQNQEVYGVVVIRPDASLDTSGEFGFEFGSSVYGLAASPTTIYAVGRFLMDDFNDVFGVAKLNFPPPAPSGLAASVSIHGLVSLSWTDESDNEVGFEIERKPDGGSPEFWVTDPDATSHQENNISPFTTYHYRIRSIGDEGVYSDFDGPVSIFWDPTPEAPDELAGSVDLKTVSLTWVDNAINETGFIIQRKLMPNGSFVTINTVAADAESFVDLTADYSQTYMYQVAAINIYAQSSFSNSISITTEAPPTPAPPDVLTASVNIKDVQLSWNDNSDNETGFEIQRKVMPNGAFVAIETVAADTEDYVDYTTAFMQSYTYRVAALNTFGLSPFSNSVSVSTPAPPIPAAPNTLVGTVDGKEVQLSWNDNSDNETGFEIQRKLLPNGPFVPIDTAAANVHNYVDLTAGFSSTYAYAVASLNSYGKSVFTNIVLVSTLTTPAAPANLSVELVDGSAKLTWDDLSTTEAGFLVERRIGGSAFVLLDSIRVVGTELFLDESDGIDAGYSYRVAAYNLAGASPYSNVADVPVIAGLENRIAVSYSPNPVTTTLRIQFSSSDRNEIQLFDAAGRQVLEAVKEEGIQVLTLSLEHLSPGLYLISTQQPGVSFRVIKN